MELAAATTAELAEAKMVTKLAMAVVEAAMAVVGEAGATGGVADLATVVEVASWRRIRCGLLPHSES